MEHVRQMTFEADEVADAKASRFYMFVIADNMERAGFVFRDRERLDLAAPSGHFKSADGSVTLWQAILQ